jgi:xanthine dehydrogenase YagS FAD-binding subunit
MQPFAYHRALNIGDAVRLGASGSDNTAQAMFIAGGTLVLDLMKLGTFAPAALVDINDLAKDLSTIDVQPTGLRLGALARMSDVAAHPQIIRNFPVIAQSLTLAASAQLRNMASLGGNVLQRTRCPYFRDTSWEACNKRKPGSGCSALEGVNRKHAVLGVTEACISTYPGDFAQALVALDAEVSITGSGGLRRIRFEDLHRDSSRPEVETVLQPGDLITEFFVPATPWARRSLYLKIRDRQSYEFALASAAVALDLDGDIVREARIGLGGVAYRPWRARGAEASIKGKKLDASTARAAADTALSGSRSSGGNDYKINLAKRTIVRALMQARDLEI